MKFSDLDFTQPLPPGDHPVGRCVFLRVRGDGASWVLRFTSAAGRRREMGLGAFRVIGRAEAYAEREAALQRARDAKTKLVGGIDPIDERKERRASFNAQMSKKRSFTVIRMVRLYHEKFVEPRRTRKHAAQWISSCEQHLPQWLKDKPVSEVRSDELIGVFIQVMHRVEETGNRIRQRLDVAWEWAINQGLADSNSAGVRRNTRAAWRQLFGLDMTPSGETAAAADEEEAA